MTPEQRARDLMANAIPDGMDEASFGELDEYLHTRIAAAIRSAENDKLEEAARAVDALEIPRENYRLGRTYWSVHVDTLDEASTAVRSLIQKD